MQFRNDRTKLQSLVFMELLLLGRTEGFIYRLLFFYIVIVGIVRVKQARYLDLSEVVSVKLI